MMRLTLIRHAKAEPARADQEDWDRALEARGQADAAEMAKRLKGRDLIPTLVLSSPAVRAITTAKLMGPTLGAAFKAIMKDERLYLAAPKEMLRVVQEHGATHRHVMLYGHNPGITEFADQLSRERSIDNMPTCAVYTLEFALDDWSDLRWGSGMNAEFDYPKNF